MRVVSPALLAAVLASIGTRRAHSQRTPGLDSLLAPHRTAMEKLDSLDGLWRGSGWTLLPNGTRATFTQTLRVGTMGEGGLKLLEGRTYDTEGQLAGTNLEIFSYSAATQTYSLRLYTQGTAADVPITPTGAGFTLEYGPASSKTRFTITAAGGTWYEVAERSAPGQPSVRFLELTLRKVSTTDWPAAGALGPKPD